MFRLLDNDRPACYPEIKVHESWNNCDFETFDELIDYADHWLGISHSPGKDILRETLGGGANYYYSGGSDWLSIIFVKEKKMLIKANRVIQVQLSNKQIADGHLSLILNTDLNSHAYLSGIPTSEINKVLGDSLEILILALGVLKRTHDKRGYSE